VALNGEVLVRLRSFTDKNGQVLRLGSAQSFEESTSSVRLAQDDETRYSAFFAFFTDVRKTG